MSQIWKEGSSDQDWWVVLLTAALHHNYPEPRNVLHTGHLTGEGRRKWKVIPRFRVHNATQMRDVHKIHSGDSTKPFFLCFPQHKQGFSVVVSESVFLIKVLNLWLLTLISLVDINLSFNLLSVSVFVVVVFFPSIQDIHHGCTWVNKQPFPRRRHRDFCFPQSGREETSKPEWVRHHCQHLDATLCSRIYCIATVFLKLGLHIRVWEKQLSELPEPPFLRLAPLRSSRWMGLEEREKGTCSQLAGLWLVGFVCECH